jgi:hypothetical protein
MSFFRAVHMRPFHAGDRRDVEDVAFQGSMGADGRGRSLRSGLVLVTDYFANGNHDERCGERRQSRSYGACSAACGPRLGDNTRADAHGGDADG